MINFIKRLLDWLYKKKCYCCGSSVENIFLCSSCSENIDFLKEEPISTIEDHLFFSSTFYSKNIKKLIRGLKYHNQKELAFFLAKIMFEYWSKINKKSENYIIIPVPLHFNRIKTRKYNHMDLVAQEFSVLTGFKYKTDFLKRIKDTIPQYKLTKFEREENLKDAFKIENKLPLDSNILLIDDISTTGSTFLEIIKELKRNGYKNITAFSISIPEKNSFYTY